MSRSPASTEEPSTVEPVPRIAGRGTRSLMRFPHIVGFVVAYGIVLVVLALRLPGATFEWFFSEEGPVEILSCGFWLLLAGACLTLPGLPRRPWQQGIAAIVAAAREADLHKALTEMSVLKTSYYLKSPAPLTEKLVAALVTLPAVILVAYVLVRGALFIRRMRAWRFDWGRTVLLATALLFASKVLDRSEALGAAWFGFHAPLMLHRFIAAFEEGVECLLPILFLVVLLQYQQHFAAGGDRQESP